MTGPHRGRAPLQAKKRDQLADATRPARDYAVFGETAFLLMDPLGLSQILTPDEALHPGRRDRLDRSTGPPDSPSAALSDAVSAAFDDCVEIVRIGSVPLFDSVLAKVRRILEDVRKVVEAAIEAVRNVAGPMSGIQSDLAANARPNFVEWKGGAADYYRDRVGEQEAAAKHVAATAQFIGDWLVKGGASAGTGYGSPTPSKR